MSDDARQSRRIEQYTDIREMHPEWTKIPCRVCGEKFFVQKSFAYNHDDWYCDECKPEELKEAVRSVLPRNKVTVRL